MSTYSRRLRLISGWCGAVALISACGSGGPDPSSGPVPVPPTLSDFERNTQAIVECLNRSGWNVTYDRRDNSITREGPADQSGAYRRAYEECSAPYEAAEKKLGDFTEADWRRVYSLETATAECLRREGIDVPDIPAFQTFVDRYPTADVWFAWDFVNVTENRYYELLEKCPQPSL